jgi:hypothetical protein
VKDFTVFQFDDDILIFVNSTEDIYFLYDMVYDELSGSLGENFSVIVDLFLRNGFSFNRFISLSFNGRSKVKSQIINPRDISEELKFNIRLYLKNNLMLFEECSLPKKIISFIQIA